MKAFIQFLALCFVAFDIMAAGLSVPFTYDSAKVLPKGVRNFRYNNMMTVANDKFDGAGTVVPLGNAMNVDVTFKKMIDGKDTVTERGVLEGYLNRHNIDTDQVVGQTTGVVNVEVDAHVPIFAWGITRKWTSAVVVPVMKSKTNMDTGFVANSNLQSLVDQLTSEGKRVKAVETRDKTDNAIFDKVAKYGYQPMANEEKTMLGDIRLVNKYNLTTKSLYAFTLSNSITLPTGEEADINKVVDVGAGDGQFDVGFGMSFDFNPREWLTFSFKASYTWQIADTTARRIPEESDSSLTPDIDMDTKRDLGDIVFASAGTNVEVLSGLNIKGQYTFQYKERDEYSGLKFESHRYHWASKETRQNMHSFLVGLGYTTIPLFKSKKFPVPMDFTISMGKAFAGKNVSNDPSYAAELAIYF